MINIPGYQTTELLYESAKTIIYRGYKGLEQIPVTIKALKTEYPTTSNMASIKHEFEITKDLNIPGIIKSYGLEKVNNKPVLILEGFVGEPLIKIINSQGMRIEKFMRVAIQMTEALGELHKHHIIHKDIKPHNIIVNPETWQVKLIDFSIASRLSKEMPSICHLNVLEGTLAYMSPEQTSRMNRVIDYRTDFYSLGVTLYEMLTGVLPFSTTDPMEVIHCHLAVTPVPPHLVNPEIPPSVSAVVMKLLAKTAEERYQNAYGIKADLETCLAQLHNPSFQSEFIPGQQDISGEFEIPQKLYGREAEVATLMAAFTRVSGGGQAAVLANEMMLVAGYSGIGKSALVNEIQKPMVRQRGYFIAGKFDQYKRNIPYVSLIQAFRELMRQLLTESGQQLQIWQEKLLAAFGENGQVIIDVIPEVELIVGKQPDVAQIGAVEAQNRFNLVFQNFVHVFSQKSHPLVIFLDDLQWADTASLKLIQMLLTSPDGQYLLIIGAYRDNEVSPTHPLMLTLGEMQQAGVMVNTITLQPLSLTDVTQLITDTLKCPPTEAHPLAELVLQKTNGNPFFLTQLLKYFYQENFLHFNFKINKWQWDIAFLQEAEVTDNVVELMVSNIQKLTPETQNILKLAACIGNRFPLDVLSFVDGENQSITASKLWEALQSGLVLPTSDAYKVPLLVENCDELFIGYKFLHDRVQQAAYALIPEKEKKQTHLQIGQLLLAKTNRNEREENIFDIVNHLNMGAELMTTESDKANLASLNLVVGRKAKLSAAYEPALNYFTFGTKLLDENSWLRHYELTLALYAEAAEAAYLSTEFEQMETLITLVLQHAQSLLDKMKVYEIKIQACIAQNNLSEAVNIALYALQLLGEGLPQKLTKLDVFLGLTKIKFALLKNPIDNLDNLPQMMIPEKKAAMRILSTIVSATAYLGVFNLFALIIFKQVNLSFKYGNTAESAYAYTNYGTILCGFASDIKTGYQFGLLALKLLKKFNIKESKINPSAIIYFCIKPWQEHLKETSPAFLESYLSSLETGHLENAARSAFFYCYSLYQTGKELEQLEWDLNSYSNAIAKLKQKTPLHLIKILHQTVLNLLDKSENPCNLIGETYDETEILLSKKVVNDNVISSIYANKLFLCYLFGNYSEAVENGLCLKKYSNILLTNYSGSLFYFYTSLAELAVFHHLSKAERKVTLAKVKANQKKMREWANHASMNFLHKFYLVEAEKARVLGQDAQAMEYYDYAIDLAKKHAYIQEEALAHELAAKFYLAKKKDIIAKAYMLNARYCYRRWGATAKVKALEIEYAELLSSHSHPEETDRLISTISTTITSNSNSLLTLDLATVVKASQALSSEIVFTQLLKRLMKIVIENAGAQAGFLLLEKSGQLLIEAEGRVERDDVQVLQSIPIEINQYENAFNLLPLSIINYVERTQETVVLNEATIEGIFTTDSYIKNYQPKSILCTPILNQGKLIGILYLENNLSKGVFTTARLEVLKLLCSQAAISIENARLYNNLSETTDKLKASHQALEFYSKNLEQKVEERTRELQEKNDILSFTLHELQQTQAHLLQSEKMSSLGQMVAGVAHEINNPVNFIYANLPHANQYTQDLLRLVQTYQQHYPHPVAEIQQEADEIDLSYVIEDLPKIFNSMEVGAERIRQIVLSLRNFSRLNEADRKIVDIHEGLESTLLLLQHRFRQRPGRPEIRVIKEYGPLPQMECYPGQLNQVFMNILANAVDALEGEVGQDSQEESFTLSPHPDSSSSPTIQIQTQVLSEERVAIRIRDNGGGMTDEVCAKIFDPFFTTKPVGKGTGLGLSISYQLIVQKHGGQLTCTSLLGQGTEFCIELPIRLAN